MKIVTIGGGTGQFRMLSSLKDLPVEITAIVSMADSGGSTGRLRDEYGVLPPGDVLKCLIALSPFDQARDILQSRFGGEGKLKQHNAGNLLLVFLSQYLSGDFAQAVEALGQILQIKGKVLPVTTDKATLVAELEDGTFLNGETEIDVVHGERKSKIKRIFLVPHNSKLEVYAPVMTAIAEADFVLIGPGDIYTSIIPNLLVPGLVAALQNTKAQVIYFPNIMTKFGESDDFTTEDFILVVEKYLQRQVDQIIANETMPEALVIEKYLLENAKPVVISSDDERIVRADLLTEGSLARHDIEKLKQIIKKHLGI